MKKKQKQPLPKPGDSFTGWAVYNWGMPWNKVYRTRKEARAYCARNNTTAGIGSWHDVKDHMAVVKVKCIVE